MSGVGRAALTDGVHERIINNTRPEQMIGLMGERGGAKENRWRTEGKE